MKVSDQKISRPVSKNWLCHTKHLEFIRKMRVRPNNGNLYHYAGNNPVKYVDPDGKFVTNNTDDYLLIKTEDAGYVILAPHAVYTGKNISNYFSDTPIDGGKIDGVILSSGKIAKISDSTETNDKTGIAGNVNLVISANKFKIGKETFNFTIAYMPDLKSHVLNFLSNFGKIIKKGRFDISGKYKVGTDKGAGKWLPRGLTQNELKSLCNDRESIFYSEEEIKKITSTKEDSICNQ